MNIAIDLQNVSKTYSAGRVAVQALQPTRLQLRQGELLFLMGPSGSGKTTLLSIMGCLLRPSQGRLFICGREVTRLTEAELPAVRRHDIGFIFQGFNLFPTLTVSENVELMLNLKGTHGREASRQAEALLAQVGLGAKCAEYPQNLSGGQKQRVAIARALASDPPILLADEPTAALDSRTGQAVLELLQRLAHEKNRAVAVVTHDPRLENYADRVIRLEDGRILETPRPEAFA